MDPILLAVDLKDDEDLLSVAVPLAQQLSCRIELAHVAPPEPDFVGYGRNLGDRREAADVLREEHRSLTALADEIGEGGRVAVGTHLLRGATVETLVELAESVAAKLIVVGRHRRSALQTLVLGSVSQGLLKSAPCPVLVVPRSARGSH